VSADPLALVVERVRSGSRFIVATHENPDGDALGSLVAMHGLLRGLGKQALVLIAQRDLPLPPEYSTLELADVVHNPPAELERFTAIALDCGNLDRTAAAALEGAAELINIDHHHDNTRFGTVNLVDPNASCTAEIVFALMGELGFNPTPALAEALYIGLVTDTGRFMYENTGPQAHRMAAALIEAGVDVPAVYHRLYEEIPEAKLALLARGLSRVQRFDSGSLTVCVLEREDFEELGAEQSFSEGIVDHLRAVAGTRLAALVRGVGDGAYKVSLRSSDELIDVSRIARAQGGGGHRRAAGFRTELAPAQLIEFLRAELAAQLDGKLAQPSPRAAGAL